jgi:hypothetical protein
MLVVITVLTLRAVEKTRSDARDALTFSRLRLCKLYDHEWLHSRTLHVRGIPPEDRAGLGLQAII